MKRDEKNVQSRKKILESAFEEFGEQGYGLSSINTICNKGNISKGIIYHYFKDKDELYLVCIQELFDSLSAHLTQELCDVSGSKVARLERYFDARLAFFHEHPLYHKLFCDVVIAPPIHLAESIRVMKSGFDQLNIAVLRELLVEMKLRNDVSMDMAVETFRLYQDFVNARYQMDPYGKIDLEKHEENCKRSLSILLYGVIEKEEIKND